MTKIIEENNIGFSINAEDLKNLKKILEKKDYSQFQKNIKKFQKKFCLNKKIKDIEKFYENIVENKNKFIYSKR